MGRTARRNNFKVSIAGAKELDKALENMGDEAGKFINAAVDKGGEIALQAAKANAPVDTGNLSRNIIMSPVIKRVGKAGKKTRTVSGSVTIGAARTKKGASGDAYYGTFVELGTKYQKAVFYLRDAVDRNKQRISEAIVRHFKGIRG